MKIIENVTVFCHCNVSSKYTVHIKQCHVSKNVTVIETNVNKRANMPMCVVARCRLAHLIMSKYEQHNEGLFMSRKAEHSVGDSLIRR